MKKKNTKKSHHQDSNRPFVGDYGTSLETHSQKASIGFGMTIFSATMGFVIGFFVWTVLVLASFLTELLWIDLGGFIVGFLNEASLDSWWIPLLFCTLGGLIIGLFTKFCGGQPETLDKVLGEVKETGGFVLERPGASVVGFFLPLVFGGSIGPEAGLTGIIAGACTRFSVLLRKAGLQVKSIADVTISAALSAVFASPFAGIVAASQDALPKENAGNSGADGNIVVDPSEYDFRRKAKIVLYTAAGLGAAGGVALFTVIFGAESGLPRFESIMSLEIGQLGWCIPCLLVGYLGALLYHLGESCFSRLSNLLGNRVVLKPVIAGFALGITAIYLPFVLFSGETQTLELMKNWQEMGAFVLIGTGLAKCLATSMCLNLGWHGGHFFPCIFAGIACGYGIAGISGADPMLCVAITTGTLLAGVQRNALTTLALLLLCFPVSSIVWMGLACLCGAILPMPFLNHKVEPPSKERVVELNEENIKGSKLHRD